MEFLQTLNPSEFQILLQVAVAMILGALIGLEREAADKPAGLRTLMLVSGAAALMVILSEVAAERFYADLGSDAIRSDPIRILEAVVAGVSFLGAGTIIRRGSEGHVEGITTAASMLFAAATGVAVALGQFVIAVGATFLALLTLRGVTAVERWLAKRDS